MGITPEELHALEEANKRFRYILEATSDIVWDWNVTEGILYRGAGFNEGILGDGIYKANTLVDLLTRIHPDETERVKRELKTLMENPAQTKWQSIYRYRNDDREYIYMRDRAKVIRDEAGEVVRIVGAMQNVTNLKGKEERATRFQEVIGMLATDKELPQMPLPDALVQVIKVSAETMGIARASVWILDASQLRCLASYDNGEMNKLHGAALLEENFPTYFKEIRSRRTIASPDTQHDERLQELVNPYFNKYDVCSLLDTSVQTFGRMQAVVCHESVKEQKEWSNNEISFAGAVTDQIAQLMANDVKKKKEQELLQSLREKEILLAEIHHRVKNNLAVISGMVQLQAYKEEDESLRRKLLSWVNRIGSIATIHEQLYQSESFSKLELSESVMSLVKKITASLETEVSLDFTMENIEFNINQAIPCALIVNEVVTNVIKHAFAHQDEKHIKVDLREEGGNVHLAIWDNGKGIVPDFDPGKKSDSMGHVLIRTLAKQLDADYTFRSQDGGTLFRLAFAKAEVRGPGSAHFT